ncbi:MAG: DMT family transporter, partial [Muribaculaceae bacterium]
MTRGEFRGHAAMLMANMVWGAMSPISKSVLQSGLISPIALSAVRIIGGTLLFVVAGLFLPSSVIKSDRIQRCDYVKIFVASFLIITVNQALYIVGIGYTSPIDSAVMSTLTPVFTMICAAIFLKLPITVLKAVGVVFGLVGALIMVVGQVSGAADGENPMLGDSMCMVAQLCAALYYVLFKDIITKYSAFALMRSMFVCSSCTFGVLMLPEILKTDFTMFALAEWLSLGYIIVFATFIAYLLIPVSQKVLKPTAVAMYTYFQPVTSALLAAVLGL